MATVNRYTQLSTPRYSPMSLQELMLAPAYKRQQHDAMSESIADTETQLAQIDSLDIHSEIAKAEQQRLYDELNKRSELLAREGFNNTTKSDILRLNKDYQTTVGPTGTLGKIQSAKKTLELNKASYIANSTKLGYPADVIAENWKDEEKKYADEFAKTGNITNIQERYSPNYINTTDRLTDLFSKANVTSNELGTLTSSIITNDPNNPGQYILTNSAKESHSNNIVQLQAAVDYVNNQISNPNSEIGRSLKEQRKTVAQALQEVEGLNKVFEKSAYSNVTSSEISGYKSAAELGVNTDNSVPLKYEFQPDSTVEVYSDAVISKLDNILNKVPITTGGGPKMKMQGTGLNMSGSVLIGKYATTTEPASISNQLDGKEREDYDRVFKALQQNDETLTNASPYSVQGVKAVRDYLNTNKSIQRQDIIITDDFVKVYGDRSIGADKTTRTSIAESVKANPENRKYSINGKVLSYDQLPDDIKENFDKVTYSGYYSPKNFNTEKYGTKENKKLFVSPLKMQYRNEDGSLTTMLVSRDATELNSPEYAADTEFNDTFINTNKFPDIPYAIPLPNGKPSNTQVVYLTNKVVQNRQVMSYMMNQKDESGNFGLPTLVTEDQLQDFFMNANYAVPRSAKKKK